MDFIVGGMPELFLNRRVIFESNSEKMREGFDTERHPRTAIGLRPDGTWVFVIVDGRQPELSVGMSLKELTQVLLSLGCVDALNLDGGGSSTLYYRGQVVNSPSDTTKERPVSDAIVILRK
jgi:exopolysaccharide biosynthesis protein